MTTAMSALMICSDDETYALMEPLMRVVHLRHAGGAWATAPWRPSPKAFSDGYDRTANGPDDNESDGSDDDSDQNSDAGSENLVFHPDETHAGGTWAADCSLMSITNGVVSVQCGLANEGISSVNLTLCGPGTTLNNNGWVLICSSLAPNLGLPGEGTA